MRIKKSKLFENIVLALGFLFFYLLMHEFTHLVLCIKLGLKCYITLSPMGFETRLIEGNLTEEEKPYYQAEIMVKDIVPIKNLFADPCSILLLLFLPGLLLL